MCPLRFQLVRSERRYARVLRLMSSVEGWNPGGVSAALAPASGDAGSRNRVLTCSRVWLSSQTSPSIP